MLLIIYVRTYVGKTKKYGSCLAQLFTSKVAGLTHGEDKIIFFVSHYGVG